MLTEYAEITWPKLSCKSSQEAVNECWYLWWLKMANSNRLAIEISCTKSIRCNIDGQTESCSRNSSCLSAAPFVFVGFLELVAWPAPQTFHHTQLIHWAASLQGSDDTLPFNSPQSFHSPTATNLPTSTCENSLSLREVYQTSNTPPLVSQLAQDVQNTAECFRRCSW